jgi:hypothetical protein
VSGEAIIVQTMIRRGFVVVAVSMLVAVSSCGGSDDGAADSAVSPSQSTVEDVATTEPASDDSVVATDPTVPDTAAAETEATGGCPIGTWQVDGPGLEPFYAVAAPPDVTFTPTGRFVLEIGPETYQAVAEGFSLAMDITGGVSMVADVSGTVSGTIVDTGTTIEFVETSFDLDAVVTMDGAPMPNDTVLGAMRETFGTGSRPYVCDGSTMTVTYDTPSGPAVVVFSPA